MSNLVHFEFPPPRSWEQFEELCADLFEAMWSDPGLVRHGRAGQPQHGVDIVAARGSIFPVGLQCKKKARWPGKKLSFAEVKSETDEADKFSPLLKEFYILTTALGDERLENQVRAHPFSYCSDRHPAQPGANGGHASPELEIARGT